MDPNQSLSVKKVKTLLDEIIHGWMTDLVTERVLRRLDEMGKLKGIKTDKDLGGVGGG